MRQLTFQTSRTLLTWTTLEEWLDCAWRIEHRRPSALRSRQAQLHILALPAAVVYQCRSRATLALCNKLLRSGPTRFCQPPRGQRQDAAQTPLIVAIANRITQIDRAEDHASMKLGHNSRNAPACSPDAPAGAKR